MQKHHYHFLARLVAIFALVLIALVTVAAFVPKEFPTGTIVHVPKNIGVSGVANLLEEKHVISSPLLFKVATISMGGQKRLAAGDYYFEQPQNLWTVVGRLVRGEQGLTPIKITIPEGATVYDVAWLILKKIPTFNAPYFIKIAQPYEGYLFPDTYNFYINATPEQILTTMRQNFLNKFQNLIIDVALSHRKPEDIVIMASILEKEGRTIQDRAMISGILWKRLDEGMPLQVDATVVYVTGDGKVSIDDTKVDSPYNTYKNKGLPPTAISNPGIEALRAAAQPIKSQYYYYLSDLKGQMHYAATFEGHQDNRVKYLGK